MADQALNSVTNIVATVLVAHAATLQQFGVFATVQFAVVLGQTIAMGAMGDRWLQTDVRGRAACFATGLAVYRWAGLLAPVLAVAFSFVFGFNAWLVGLAAIPAIAAIDYVRIVLFAEGRLRTALVMDVVFGALQLTLIGAWLAASGWRGATGAWLAWATAAYCILAAFGSGLVRVQPAVPRGDRAAIGSAFSIRYAGEAVALNGAALLSLLIVSGRLGVTFNGLFRIAQIPFGPLIVLIQAARALLIPAFRGAKRGSGRRILAVTVGAYSVLCAVFTAVTYIVSEVAGLRPLLGGVHLPPAYVFLTGQLFLTVGVHLLIFFYFRARQWDAAVTFSRMVLVASLLVCTVSSYASGSEVVFLLTLSLSWVTAILSMVGYQAWRSRSQASAA